MMVTKDEIRDRLKTLSAWVTADWTAIGTAVDDDKFRYVIALWIGGDNVANRTVQLSKLAKGGSVPTGLSALWGPIPVPSTEFRQIPEGSYDIEDPVAVLEGGTRLYGKVDGNSLNVAVTYWDSDV
jgi:hypothetical protein